MLFACAVDSRQFGNSAQLSGWVTAIYSNEDREQRITGGKQLLEYVTDQNNAKVCFLLCYVFDICFVRLLNIRNFALLQTVSRSADALFEALYGIFSER